MTVATGPVQYFVRDKTSDPLGRWSSITLAGRNQRRIRITTAYNVCSNSKPGISTAYFQQYVLLLQTDPEPNPLNFNEKENRVLTVGRICDGIIMAAC